jgi:hypothetical protein
MFEKHFDDISPADLQALVEARIHELSAATTFAKDSENE